MQTPSVRAVAGTRGTRPCPAGADTGQMSTPRNLRSGPVSWECGGRGAEGAWVGISTRDGFAPHPGRATVLLIKAAPGTTVVEIFTKHLLGVGLHAGGVGSAPAPLRPDAGWKRVTGQQRPRAGWGGAGGAAAPWLGLVLGNHMPSSGGLIFWGPWHPPVCPE